MIKRRMNERVMPNRKESTMKPFIKVAFMPAIIALPFVMTCCTSLAERETKPTGSPPVITNSFASKEVAHGDVWRINLEAHDPDRDMQKIVCFIQQLGSGHSAASVSISKGDEASLFGTLGCYISHPQSGVSEWTGLTLTIFIRDRGGNVSNKVVFPVEISSRARQEKPPPPFDSVVSGRLGRISVRLFYPTE
jgi:hypothetical protein